MESNHEKPPPSLETPLLDAQRSSSPPQHHPAQTTFPLDTESVPDDENLRRRSHCHRFLSSLRTVMVDERGSGWPVAVGLLVLALLGTVLGTVLPGDAALPPWSGGGVPVRFLSNAIGYTYFMAWSFSFYPQIISNFRRKSTVGLSPDFCALNVLGFGCYAVYNVGFFYNATIQRQYRTRHGDAAAIPVQSNDVAFAVHALCLASLTLGQVGYYNAGFRGRSSRPSAAVLGAGALFLAAAVAAGPALALVAPGFEWLDYLYLLGRIKVAITLMKYVPQVVLNYRRRSTEGWSIWNIILDFTGGALSDVQLVLDCGALRDWTGITGNLTKLALGSVSVVFDLVFMAQHYLLYPGNGLGDAASEGGQDGRPASSERQSDPMTGARLIASDEHVL